MKNKEVKTWQCAVCNIITMGEWDAEARPIDSKEEEDWQPICKACTIDVRKEFVPDEEFAELLEEFEDDDDEDYTRESY